MTTLPLVLLPSMVLASPCLTQEPFGKLADGRSAELYTLRSAAGEVAITNYGGIIVALRVPDRAGQLADITLGYDTLDGYLPRHPYFGCIVGRYANRIAKGQFTLAGRSYKLAINNGPNHLHGGQVGFDRLLFKAQAEETPEGPRLTLTASSPDGDEGYPGQVDLTCVYTWTHSGILRLDYRGVTAAPTILNLTNHAYFNLAGAGSGPVGNHLLRLRATRYVPTDEGNIPTGELAPVAGTPFDFTTPHRLGERIDADHQQLKFGLGYDHCFVLGQPTGMLVQAARVDEPTSGRYLECWTTAPGVQLYTGNHLNPEVVGKGGVVYDHRTGFCLEPGLFPDSPNQPGFLSPALFPGQLYRNVIEYRFGVSRN
ncbi:MAG: galactose mutarotase [Fimbriimonadaceae bacterium]|nr:galactose mutarotase [Fimbriimonadaceae bacterium]